MASRVVDIEDGVAMVVTDLHGAGEVYRQLRRKFLRGREQGSIDRFVICGDLIHAAGETHQDASLKMLLDVMYLQVELGSDRVIMLLGNHEMPHIYGTTLAKGDVEFTPSFETALAHLDRQPEASYRRQDVIDFLAGLPFYARTRAGVLLSHAGAALEVLTLEKLNRLLTLDHTAVLAEAERKLHLSDVLALRRKYAEWEGTPYDELARYYLAVSGPRDPRYDHLLRALFLNNENADFMLLWDALFSRNEYGTEPANYLWVVETFLRLMSEVSPHEQCVLVAGHLAVKGGYALVGEHQLRLASYAHAHPKEAGRYLLLDCANPVQTASDLLSTLRPVFEE